MLRRWPQLKLWLLKEQQDLTILQIVKRDSERWLAAADANKVDLLVHQWENLEKAEALLSRTEFVQELGDTGKKYLQACSVNQKEGVRESERQLSLE